jgi:DNA-binding LacI/PurR family transcriptional regulator
MAATIYDVARKAGVSTATVSKVLSNTPYVSTQTRAKVLAAVQDLSYVPNLAARSLSKARTFIVGLFIPYAADTVFADPHVLDLIRGIEEEVGSRGYSLLLSTAGDARQAPGRSGPRGAYADGAVLIAPSVLGLSAEDLGLRPDHCVVVGYHSPCGQGNTVHADDRAGAVMATEHLLHLGHDRIGVISATQPIAALERRLEGHRDALQAAGQRPDPQMVANGDFSLQSGYLAAQSLLALRPQPTAIFALNDRMAMGAMRLLKEQGLAIPADVTVVGFDDIPAAALFDPPLTTVRQPARLMGATAAQKLLSLIEGDGAPFDDVELPAQLMVRASSGPVSAVPESQGGAID